MLVDPAQIMGTYGSPGPVASPTPSAGALTGRLKSHLLLGIGRAEQEVDTTVPLKKTNKTKHRPPILSDRGL